MFYYVYILQSEKDHNRFYTGFTKNLDIRLTYHNSGRCPHTSKFKPWRIKTAIAFTDREKALDFEKYLKTSSGRAFVKKSFEHPNQTYIGFTENLKTRLASHNSGQSSHTAKFKPWELITYLAFSNRSKALSFEPQ